MLKSLFSLLSLLPLRLLLAFSSLSYYFVYYIVRYRRKITRDNINHAFPEQSPAQRLKLEQDYYRFITDMLFEVIKAYRFDKNDLLQRIEFTNPELLQPYIEQQQTFQLLGIHQGNSEWIISILNHAFNVPVDLVYKPMHDAKAEQLFFHMRSRFGGNLIATHRVMKDMLKRRREFRAFAMSADQAPVGNDKKYWTMFFNRPSSFVMGPQVVAEITQGPVFFIQVKRPERARYQVSLTLLAEPPYTKGEFNVIESYIEHARAAILAQPETWLWSNRKWKRKPRAEDSKSCYAMDFPQALKPVQKR